MQKKLKIQKLLIMLLAMLMSILLIGMLVGKTTEQTPEANNELPTAEVQDSNENNNGLFFLYGVVSTIGVTYLVYKTSGYKLIKPE